MSQSCPIGEFILFVKNGCSACESIKIQLNRCRRCRDVRMVDISRATRDELDLFYTYCDRRVVPFMVSISGGRVQRFYGESIINALR